MKTEILDARIDYNIKICADIIKTGGLVGVPTETVYGLGANALDEKAVSGIFTTKGRASDNPLIVHIAKLSELDKIVSEKPKIFQKLAKSFWPGPLTLIMKKSDYVPDIVTSSLDSVAVRMPAHPVMQQLIEESGVPIAAPSANLSGKPSPTKASHVFDDLNGRIPFILNGGDCNVGVESTVLDITSEIPHILRPGGVTHEQLLQLLDVVESFDFSKNTQVDAPRSPGMKYRHYSPDTPLIAVIGSHFKTAQYIKSQVQSLKKNTENIQPQDSADYFYAAALMFDDYAFKDDFVVTFGKSADYEMQANRLFDALRELDTFGADVIYVQVPEERSVGYAVVNRILKAASKIINM